MQARLGALHLHSTEIMTCGLLRLLRVHKRGKGTNENRKKASLGRSKRRSPRLDCLRSHL